ncbi:hypothetical protein L6164_011832 [Bauhinia variegata]|uniref:Uncharacterized protein n=1 Tax=Bauhinia variegata TaxID=167791 RepID=A0ACB9P830_BAUVA|nr:hypothetical protein L6164_011832 [Bauhinia variegata]
MLDFNFLLLTHLWVLLAFPFLEADHSLLSNPTIKALIFQILVHRLLLQLLHHRLGRPRQRLKEPDTMRPRYVELSTKTSKLACLRHRCPTSFVHIPLTISLNVNVGFFLYIWISLSSKICW